MKIELELNDDVVTALVKARKESDNRLTIHDAAVAALTTGLAAVGHMPGSFAESVVQLTKEEIQKEKEEANSSENNPLDFMKGLMGGAPAGVGFIGVRRDGDNVTVDGLDNIPEQWREAAESLARVLSGAGLPDDCTCDVCLARRSAKKYS